MMFSFLFSCTPDESSATGCGDGVLVGSECEDASTEPWEDGPRELDGGFPTTADTGLDANENWLDDPGFEEGLLATPWNSAATPPGWTASGSPAWLRTGAGLESGDAHGGEAVVALESGDELHQSVERLLTFDDRYVVRAWTRADTPTNAEVAITFLDASGGVLVESVAPITAWPEWRVHALGVQGPEELQHVSAAIRGAGAAAWFDDIRLEIASTDPVAFDLSATAHAFEGFGVQLAPQETAFLPETMAALGLRFVRVSVGGAKDAELVAAHAATGKASWLVTSDDAVEDAEGFAQGWVSRVLALDALGIRPEAIELLDDPSTVDETTYAALVDATRSALDAAALGDVAIAGPGTRTLLEGHEARDFLLALGNDAPVGAWSFQTGDDGWLCSGGASCLAMGWDDVLGTFDAIGGTAGHPIWGTRVGTSETTFLGSTWPAPESFVDFNATASAAYAVRVVENALVSIAAGAARVYLSSYAADGSSTGSGLATTSGEEKPLHRALELALPLAGGATVIEPPDQTGRALYVAVFMTADDLVVLVTNEDAGHQPFELVLAGASGTETLASARSFVRYAAGDPEREIADSVGTYDISVDLTQADGKMAIGADLLPVSVTALTFDRTP
jgi:hypothetical protein